VVLIDFAVANRRQFRVPRILSHALLIIAVLTATGSHWVLLQSMAWTGMLANHLRTNPLIQAVERTFNGKDPCTLCKHISKGKQSEKKSEFKAQKKMECVFDDHPIVLSAPCQFRLLPELNSLPATVPHSPPVPPPRTLLA
jgi:hypothetical protein